MNKSYIFRIPRAQGAWLYNWFPWTPSVPPLNSVKALRARPPALAHSHFEAFLRPPPSLLPLIPSPTLHLPPSLPPSLRRSRRKLLRSTEVNYKSVVPPFPSLFFSFPSCSHRERVGRAECKLQFHNESERAVSSFAARLVGGGRLAPHRVANGADRMVGRHPVRRPQLHGTLFLNIFLPSATSSGFRCMWLPTG